MRKFMMPLAAAIVVLGGIWFAVSKPSAPAQLRAEERAIKMDVLEMMRKAKNLPEPVVGSLI